jgi:phosphatidylinositol alpha-1,6-mannosyltransferase
MRLLIVSSEFPPGPGGIGTHAYQVADHLNQLKWKTAVITRQDYASDEEIKSFNKAQPFQISRFRPVPGAPIEALYRYRVVSKRLRDWRPDILLASGSRAVWLSAWVAQQRGLSVPWIAVGHGTEFSFPTIWERSLTRWSFNKATAVVCVSHHTWKQMTALGIKPRACRVIPNGADSDLFKVLSEQESDYCRSALGFNGARLLISVGHLTERKGQDVVIRALPLILEKEPKTHYLVVGLPTRKQAFSQLAHDLGVANHVHFIGRVNNPTLVSLLNCCDVLMMTSRRTNEGDFEGYGIAVVEAALCGKPAVVSANSGLVEAIETGVTGLSVPVNDEKATAKAVLSLLQNEERRLLMGKAARTRALREQTWGQVARNYDALLHDALNKTSGT